MFDLVKRHASAAANGVSRFRENSDGTLKILVGFLAIPLIFTLGTAVDTAETYRARINFQNATDAAALMVGKTFTRTGDEDAAKAAGERVFKANLENLRTPDDKSSIQFDIADDCANDGITATANMTHDLFFGGTRALANSFYGGDYDEYNEIDLIAETRVNCVKQKVEVAMVLDNSGSMGSNGKIQTLRAAASDLVSTLHESLGELGGDPVKFSIVPFSTFVNIGASNRNQSWMDSQGASSIHDEHLDWSTLAGATQVGTTHKWQDSSGNYLTRFSIYDALDISWAGCVDMRPYPHNTTDETPSSGDPDTLYVPAFAPDPPDNLSSYNRYEAQAGGVPHCIRWRSNVSRGCRRWSDGFRGRDHPTQGRAYYYSAEYGGNGVWQGGSGGVNWVNVGPETEESYHNNYLVDVHNFDTNGGANHPFNKAHMGSSGDKQFGRQKWAAKYFNNADPRDVNRNRSSLPSHGGFTGGPNFMCTSAEVTPLTANRQTALDGVADMVATGATNVHQGVAWGWRTLSEKPPFTEGRPRSERDNKKIMIVMTDGNNTYYPANFWGYSNRNKSIQGAYGMSVNDRIFEGYDDIANPNHDQGTFTKAMDSHLKKTCDNAKQDGILIYSIAFDVPNGNPVEEVLQYCSSDKYYDARNNAELIEAFQDIAEDIADLAITK